MRRLPLLAAAVLLLAPLATATPAPTDTATDTATDSSMDIITPEDAAAPQAPFPIDSLPHGSLPGPEAPLAMHVDPGHLHDLWTADGAVAAYWHLARLAIAQQVDHDETHEMGPEDHYFFMGMGDADDDGRDDVLLTRYTVAGDETEEVHFTALSAGRADQVLWDLEVDVEDEVVYPAGDLDEDGVVDMFRLDETTSDGDRFRMDAAALSGADLTPLAEFRLEGGYEHEEDELPVLVGTSSRRTMFHVPFPIDVFEDPGYTVLTIHLEVTEERQGYVVTMQYTMSVTFGTTLERRALDNTVEWSAGNEQELWAAVLGEEEGRRDLVFAQGLGTYRHEDRPLGLPPLQEEEPESRPVTLQRVSGDDGTQVWATTLEAKQDEVHIMTGGDHFGTGQTLLLGEYRFRVQQDAFQPTYEIASHLTYLSAQDGSIATTHAIEDALALPVDMGDADADGRDDILLFSFDLYRPLTVSAVRGDLSELWTRTPRGGAGAVDMTGDGVLDLVETREDASRIIDGVTGTKIWETDTEERDVRIIHDMDMDGGNDLLVFAYDDVDQTPDNGVVSIYNGATGVLVWSKQVYTATDHHNVTADELEAWGHGVADVNKDGAVELALYLYGGNDMCDECNEPPTIKAAMVLDAASGRTLVRYDGTATVPAGPTEHGPLLGPGARLMESRLVDTPGPALVMLLAALVVAAVLRRRA